MEMGGREGLRKNTAAHLTAREPTPVLKVEFLRGHLIYFLLSGRTAALPTRTDFQDWKFCGPQQPAQAVVASFSSPMGKIFVPCASAYCTQ